MLVLASTHTTPSPPLMAAEKFRIYVRFVIKRHGTKQNIINKQVNAYRGFFRNICICATHVQICAKYTKEFEKENMKK